MLFFLVPTAFALTTTPLPPLRGHPGPSSPIVRFDPTGTKLVSRAEDGVRIWTTEEGTELRFIAGRARTVSADEQLKTLIIAYDGRLERVDPETGAVMQRWPLEWPQIEGLIVEPSGRWLIASDSTSGQAVRYELETGVALDIPDDLKRGTPRAFSPSGVLHFTDRDGHLRTWDPATGKTWSDTRPGMVARVDFSAGGGWMALTAWDWPPQKRGFRSGAPAGQQPWRQGWVRVRGPGGEERQIAQTGYDLAISPRGRWIALAQDSEIRLLDGATGDVVGVLQANAVISSLDWGGNDVLVAGTANGLLERWRVTP